MNFTASHCSEKQLDGFLREQISATEEARIQSHLDRCADCRERLSELAADDSWWRFAAEFLESEENASDTPGFPAQVPEATPLQSQLKAILQPTDDPQMLGRLGGYEVSGVIGQGGMGLVLKGFDRSLNRYVALKVLRPDLAASATARCRFAREGKAAASVLHDNVIAIHGVAETNGLPYLVMPYSRGESLATRIAREGALGLNEILRIGIQVSDGLAAAHSQGLIHRDIKPSNIILESGVERLKLTDFGLARAADSVGVTRTGTLAGTPEFMSPEQARGEPIDFRSDLFSLGIVLYALCTGKSPFRADSCYGVIRRIVEFEPPSVRVENPTIPDWFAKLVQRLMNKQADARYQSADEVAEILRSCLVHVQSPTHRLPVELTGNRRRASCFATIAMLTCTLVIAGIFYHNTAGTYESAGTTAVETPDDGSVTHSGKDTTKAGHGSDPQALIWDDHVGTAIDDVRRRLTGLAP